MGLIMKKILLLLVVFYSTVSFSNIELNSVGIVVMESDGESAIYVTNTSEYEVLVYAKEELDETIKISGESIFFVSPPVSKLRPNEKQLIRVILKKKDITSQKMGRILIQEIPYIKDPNANIVSFAKSYNIPALAHPKKLIEDYEPWKKAKLELIDNQILLVNDSNYLIKMLPVYECVTDNGNIQGSLQSPYLMPNTKIQVGNGCSKIVISPVSNEGKILEKHTISKL